MAIAAAEGEPGLPSDRRLGDSTPADMGDNACGWPRYEPLRDTGCRRPLPTPPTPAHPPSLLSLPLLQTAAVTYFRRGSCWAVVTLVAVGKPKIVNITYYNNII